MLVLLAGTKAGAARGRVGGCGSVADHIKKVPNYIKEHGFANIYLVSFIPIMQTFSLASRGTPSWHPIRSSLVSVCWLGGGSLSAPP